MCAFFTPNGNPRHPIEIALEPVYNALNSMALLSQVERLPALDAWVIRAAAALAPEQRQANRLIFECLAGALLPSREWPDFPAYLADLAAQEPAALAERARQPMDGAAPDPDLRAEA